VILKVAVGEDGAAHDIEITRSLGLGLDEKAIEAVRNWRFEPSRKDGRAIAGSLDVSVDFSLKAKQSRWHLVNVGFKAPDGGSRPAFLLAEYPRGDGIFGRNAYEEGRLIGAIGCVASATIGFDINEAGIPVNLRTERASEDVWGPEAILVVQLWRFKPAMKDGRPLPAPGSVQLLWGPRELDAAIAAGYWMRGSRAGTETGKGGPGGDASAGLLRANRPIGNRLQVWQPAPRHWLLVW